MRSENDVWMQMSKSEGWVLSHSQPHLGVSMFPFLRMSVPKNTNTLDNLLLFVFEHAISLSA